jgi:hypothetical protein
VIRFTVPAMHWVSPKTGKLRPVIDAKYTEGKVPNWTRKTRYEDWKRHVQEYAVLAGLELPLHATKEEPLYIVTEAFFESGVHADVSNVWEGVCDALCYVSPTERKLGVKKGSDKYVGGLFFAPAYSREEPRVQVMVATKAEFERVCLDHHIAVIDRMLKEE